MKDYKGNYDFYLEEREKLAQAAAAAAAEAEKQRAYAEAKAKQKAVAQGAAMAAAEAVGRKSEKKDKARRYSPEEAEKLLPKVELQIREQEAMMGLLEKRMADPANHADPANSASMAAEHDEYEKKIAELMERWEVLMEALE